LYIVYKDKYTVETVNTKFLDLEVDNRLNWNKLNT